MAQLKKLATTTKKTNNQYYIPEETDSDGNTLNQNATNVVENSSNANSNAVNDNSKVANANTNNNTSNYSAVEPTTPNTTSNDTTIENYKNISNSLLAEKGTLDTSSSLYDTQANAINDKIASANTLLDTYMSNARATQSAKSEAYMAQQNANKNLKTYLANQGLANQGVAETTMANANTNYNNQNTNINVDSNANNNSAYENYLNNVRQIESEANTATTNVQSNNANVELTNLQSAVDDSGNVSTTKLNTYINEIESKYANGELSSSDYNNLQNVITQYQQQAKENQISKLGYDLTSGTDLETFADEYAGATTSGAFKEQLKQAYIEILSTAKEGQEFKIKNGKLVETTSGKGKYVIINGNIYTK